jgi:hypothetical protein
MQGLNQGAKSAHLAPVKAHATLAVMAAQLDLFGRGGPHFDPTSTRPLLTRSASNWRATPGSSSWRTGCAVIKLCSTRDLLLMGGSCQRTWQHGVPKSRTVGDQQRIAIMFRPHWEHFATR